MLSSLWSQIRGNFKYDLLKGLVAAAGVGGMATAMWVTLHHWLFQPVENWTLFAVWLISALILTLVWVFNSRLTVLEPRLESVSQFQNGTGYKRPGVDTAMVVPVKNLPRWWHSGLVESQRVIASIDFFSEDGQQLEACHRGMWLNERRPDIRIRYGETKELIVAVIEDGRHEMFAPEAGHYSEVEEPDIMAAHRRGAMLSLRPLEKHPSMLVRISLTAVGYRSQLNFRMFLGKHMLEMERLG